MASRLLLVVALVFISSCARSQETNANRKKVGGPCEGCEAIFEYGEKKLNSVDTLPEFLKSKKQLKISGIIYQKDGKTPAKNVILYAYHTDEKGIYPKRSSSLGWEKRHGYIRGWIKTDVTGRYTFYTLRPASYPNTNIPQHVHLTVKEPDKNEYYIGDVNFEDDPKLTERMRNKTKHRGGNGIVTLRKKDGILEAKRDIILGLNIPNYP